MSIVRSPWSVVSMGFNATDKGQRTMDSEAYE